MTDRKVLIAASFHRFVAEAGKPDRRETFAAGQTVTVPAADADDWIAKGLATPANHPLDHDGDGRKGGSLKKHEPAA